MSAYSAFWNYSSGNQLLAMWQLTERGLPVGPIATFRAWQDKGRYVKKGQKAIELCMPVTRKFERENAETGEKEVGQFRRFIFKRNWFALSQTDGDTYIPDPIPAWDRTQALSTLGVTEIPFQMTNGNVQGYAQEMSIAVNPLAAMPDKTTFHELGHVMLGHTMEGHSLDTEATPRNLKEVEAESVALICLESLGLTGAEFCRGYIQSWKAEIPERSAQKIFNAADKILKAGRMVEHDGTEDRQDYD
jgi:antirestriction protein ArdC